MKRVCCFTAASSAVSTPAPRWRRHVVSCAALWIVGGSAWAVPSATVLFASGEAHVLSASGQARPASRGVVVESGESIETGKGSVQLRMVDGGMMSLNERTLLRMDDYHLAGPAGNDEKGYMSLVRGALRTISGSIGKARVDRYKLDTPTGTIGIRGTEYTAAIDDGLRVGVVNGRVAVCNDGGCVDVPKGSSAYTAQRSVKPTVTTRVSVVVSPANAGPHTLAAADAPATATPPQASTATPIAGDQVSRYLVAALTAPLNGTGGSASGGIADPTAAGPAATGAPATGPALVIVAPAPLAAAPAGTSAAPDPTTAGAPAPAPAAPAAPSPAPAGSPAPAPAPAGSPGPAPAPAPTPVPPGPGPAPAPGPAPTPAPAPAPLPAPAPPPPVQAPLASGLANLGLVWATDKGALGSGLVQGQASFDTSGTLTDLDQPPGVKGNPHILQKGEPIESGADGIIAWGRWTGGDSKVNDANGSGKGKLADLHYFAFTTSPSLPVIGTFSSFAATAPTVQSGGQLVATGTSNSASGVLNTAFLTVSGGSALYSLAVPVAGQTFSLTGTAAQTSAFGFAGVSSIASNGQGCAGGCTGSLGNNISVIGLVGGTLGNRAGVTYGFNSTIGNVSGVIVFKR